MTPSEVHDKVILDAMVNLVRQVPWGPTRDELLSKALQFGREGSIEHGWDNYSTAAWLWMDERLYQLAAEARFPREGDGHVMAVADDLDYRLYHELMGFHDDSDVGETTRIDRYTYSSALKTEELSSETRRLLLEYFRTNGFIYGKSGPRPVHLSDPSDESEDHSSDYGYGG